MFKREASCFTGALDYPLCSSHEAQHPFPVSGLQSRLSSDRSWCSISTPTFRGRGLPLGAWSPNPPGRVAPVRFAGLIPLLRCGSPGGLAPPLGCARACSLCI
eukprot:713000-Heterocapsa_arctica.AAC.1